jgi:hypothetical protein
VEVKCFGQWKSNGHIHNLLRKLTVLSGFHCVLTPIVYRAHSVKLSMFVKSSLLLDALMERTGLKN